MGHAAYTPQLATLVKSPPSGDGWWHEIKFDGYRIGCHIDGTRLSLISRNGKDWTAAFPEVVEAARKLPTRSALLDGEVAMLLPDGRTSFQALQSAGSDPSARALLVYYVFDLLHLDGHDLQSRPLRDRKASLEALVGQSTRDRIRYSEHFEGDGARFLEQACSAQLEGIISKRHDRPYYHGRNSDWVKAKCGRRQELVVGGFTDPEGSRGGLGALLVGHYDGANLVFAGKVGTGFTHAGALELRKQLDALEAPTTPFEPPPPRPIARRAHWVRPELVCEVAFTEWTKDGMARHPSFQGLRRDKDPRDVRREDARTPPAAAAPQVPARRRSAPGASKASADPEVAGVRISHSDRVLYPEPTVTKLDLARYYERIADWVAPHVVGRPLTLVRCPEGLAGSCFYVKHSKTWAPEPLRRVHIQEKTKTGEYLIADDLAGIVALVQMGVLEIHTWSSMAEDVERPNRLIVDLDPGSAVEWARVAGAARLVRQALEALDLESYCKTTGGRGLHVVVPLVPHAGWDECLAFTRTLSEAIEQADPESFTTNFSKRGRDNKILLDFLRNNRGQTSVAAYSSRAREGAPVSVPLSWNELRSSLRPSSFTVKSVPSRLARLAADPWKGYSTSGQKLTARLLRAVGAIHV